jgi:hypothetical protein
MIDPEFEINFHRLQKAELDSLVALARAKQAGDQAAFETAQYNLVTNYQASRAALKQEGRKFNAELKLNPAADDDAKTAQLLLAFERGSRLSRLWHDTMQQARIGSCCAGKVINKIQPALDAMDRRGDLVAFLAHKDKSVRARAASWLLDRIPDQCLPILEGIAQTERALDAGWIAFWAIGMYENGAIPQYKGTKSS